MSENNQEPTMEEILASIRRIISEDDAPAEAKEPAAADPAPAPAPAPEPLSFVEREPVLEPPPPFAPHAADDVLELTDRIDDPLDNPEALTMSDLEVVEPPPVQARKPSPPPEPLEPLAEDEPLVGAPAASSAASAFGLLERSLLMPAAGRTLEDVVREMLRPLLKAWLDEHLPEIVEAQVKAEVERIARQRR